MQSVKNAKLKGSSFNSLSYHQLSQITNQSAKQEGGHLPFLLGFPLWVTQPFSAGFLWLLPPLCAPMKLGHSGQCNARVCLGDGLPGKG